ncbi:IS5 family transposase, partial [Coraliomargarita sp. SDUM461003]
MLEAMLWILRTGAPWRDLPKSFPSWESVYSRFRRWTELGLWAHLLAYFRSELADEEYLMIDSSGVRVHQDASRVKEANFQQAMGRSKGGLSTKIHMACDGLGYPLGFILTGAERH